MTNTISPAVSGHHRCALPPPHLCRARPSGALAALPRPSQLAGSTLPPPLTSLFHQTVAYQKPAIPAQAFSLLDTRHSLHIPYDGFEANQQGAQRSGPVRFPSSPVFLRPIAARGVRWGHSREAGSSALLQPPVDDAYRWASGSSVAYDIEKSGAEFTSFAVTRPHPALQAPSAKIWYVPGTVHR